ncbi:MAG: hypothetical protein PHJ00_00585 [Candidatus Omnitrophica bacterium]|jgi:hypothetical protein|nr:hypothetical protein [Candidatus Omnitrophota bacterium]
MVKYIISIFLFGLLVAGCAPHRGEKPFWHHDYTENTETLIMLDSGLASRLRLVDDTTERTPDSRLIVKAKLMNRLEKTLRVQVQTVFKDAKGFATGDETNWELLIIPAKAYYYYETKAMNTKAAGYVIRCRYAK